MSAISKNKLGGKSLHMDRNFALNGTPGEVGVSLKKNFFLELLFFILSAHKHKLW